MPDRQREVGVEASDDRYAPAGSFRNRSNVGSGHRAEWSHIVTMQDMTIWRYAVLVPVDRGPAFWYVDGEAVQWPAAGLSQHLARAGAKGWELTTSFGVDPGGNPQFVFKRPA